MFDNPEIKRFRITVLLLGMLAISFVISGCEPFDSWGKAASGVPVPVPAGQTGWKVVPAGEVPGMVQGGIEQTGKVIDKKTDSLDRGSTEKQIRAFPGNVEKTVKEKQAEIDALVEDAKSKGGQFGKIVNDAPTQAGKVLK